MNNVQEDDESGGISQMDETTTIDTVGLLHQLPRYSGGDGGMHLIDFVIVTAGAFLVLCGSPG